MTTVFQDAAFGSTAARGTHVLIIGVGEYPHLPGGGSRLAANPMGLRQLSSPPLSARAFADWMLRRTLKPDARPGFNNPGAPLASVEMLLSPGGVYTRPDGKDVPIDVARMKELKEGFSIWYERLKAASGSTGVLYFSGHGVMLANQFLLASDFGQSDLTPWDGALDFTATRRALQRRVQGPLFFFIDACREISRGLASAVGANPPALLSADLREEVNSSCLELRATQEGMRAWSEPGKLSSFTAALIEALSGFVVDRQTDGESLWPLSGEDLARSVRTILANDKLLTDAEMATRQIVSYDIEGVPAIFHVATEPGRNFIELNLEMWQRARGLGAPAVAAQMEARPKGASVRVFISCAEVDLGAGRRLFDALKNLGHEPWLPTLSLLPGEEIRSAISRQIRSSALFIALHSTKSLALRGQFQRERREAIEVLEQMPPSAVFIIPVRIDACDPPEDDVLRRLFWADLYPDYKEGEAKILATVQRYRTAQLH